MGGYLISPLKIFNITRALCVNGIPYVPGFSEISLGDFFHFWGVLFYMGTFFDPLRGKKQGFPDAGIFRSVNRIYMKLRASKRQY